MRQLGLGIVFRWRQENADVPRSVQDNLSGVSGTAKQAKASFAAMGVALAGLAVGVVGLGTNAGEFQRDLARVANVSGATSAELDQLRDAAIQAGIKTQFSPSQAVRGLESLASAGYGARDSMELLNPSLLLAAAGQISVGKASGTLSTILKGYSLQVSDAGRVTDIMANTAAQARIQIVDLESALGRTIRGASLTKQSFEEMAVGVGIAKNTMINASSAGNSISRALTQIGVKSDYIKDKIGVNVLDAQGNFKNWLDLVVEIGDAADKKFTNAAEKTEFFNKAIGTFGLEAFQTTLNQIRKTSADQGIVPQEAIDLLRQRFLDADGTAQMFADRLNNTFAGAVTLLGGTIETLAIVIGEPIANVLKPVVQALTQALNFLLVAFNNLPGPVKTVFGILAVGVGAVAALGAAGIAAAGAYTLLAPAVTAAATAFAGFVVAALPIIATIGLIGGAVALLVIGVRENFAGLGDLWDNTVGRIVLLTKALIQLFSSGELSGSVLEELNKVENSGIKRFAITLFQVGFRIKRFFQGIVQGLTETLGPPIRRIGRVFVRLGTAMGRVFSAVLGIFTRIGQALGLVSKKGAEAAAKTPSSSFFNAALKVARVFGTVLGFTLDLVTEVFGAIAFAIELIASGLETVIDGFKVFKPVADFAISAFNKVRDVLEDLYEFIQEVVEAAKDAIDFIKGDELTPKEAQAVVDVAVAQFSGGLFGGDRAQSVQKFQETFEQQENERNQRNRAVENSASTVAESRAFDGMAESLRQIAQRAEQPINVTVTTPSGEVLFEQTQQGAAESQARTFDVTSAPL